MKWLKKSSLRLRLISVLSLTALIIWGISSAIAWFEARKEVNQMFDAQQILLAKRLSNSNLRQILIERKLRGGFHPHRHRQHQYDDDALAFAIFTRDGEMLLSDDANGENFIFAPSRGFSHSKLKDDDDLWRIFWLPSEDKSLLIAVGQELDYREDLISDMVFGQMWVWIASLPLLISLIIVLINLELRILNQVRAQLHQRSPEDHAHLSTQNVPSEILPLVNTLNGFFDRTSDILLRERRFTSDAAHELRSPLAGLRIQTEIAQLAGDDATLRDSALNNLTQGIDRASQVIEQLLTLSRLDNLQQLDNLEQIHWRNLIESLLNELSYEAQKREIELQFIPESQPQAQQGQILLLSLMLRNLLNNALKYCAEGAQVQLILRQHELSIQDNGGGVSDEDLSKLGQRFYRPAGQNEKGSGLGLSIVKRIAELHQLQVQFAHHYNAQGQKGLQVKIIF